jgi:hypothetical protein
MKLPSYSRRITNTLILALFGFAAASQDLVAINDFKNETAAPQVKESAFEAPVHEASHFLDDEGKLYWQKKLPVYLFASSSPDGKDVKRLKSEHNPNYANPIYLDTEGVNYIRTRWAVDSEGNKILPEQEVMMEIYADGIAPKSTVNLSSLSFSDGQTTFYGKNLEATLNSKDRMSGIHHIYASIDNASYLPISNPFKIEKEGEHSIKYFAVDNVGNSEEEQTLDFTVDLTAPTTKLMVEGDRVAEVLSPKSKLVLESSDQLSGVKKVFYEFDDYAKSLYAGPIYLHNVSEGEHRIVYYAEDQVGNIEVTKEFNFFLDKTPAIVDFDIDKDKYENGGNLYTSAKSAVSFKAEDNKAGVDEIYYALGSSGFENYKAPLSTANLEGTQYLKFYGVDKVNNGANQGSFNTYGKKVNFIVDDTPPSISHQFIGKKLTLRDTTFVTSETTLSIMSNDKSSGVKSLNFSVNDAGSTSYETPFSLDKEGVYNLTVSATDNVNNSSDKNLLIVVDNTGPVITSVMGSNKIGSIDLDDEGSLEVYGKGLHVYLAATDEIIETQDIFYQLNEQVNTKYNTPIVLNDKGINTITVSAIDKLGNKSEENLTIKVFIK